MIHTTTCDLFDSTRSILQPELSPKSRPKQWFPSLLSVCYAIGIICNICPASLWCRMLLFYRHCSDHSSLSQEAGTQSHHTRPGPPFSMSFLCCLFRFHWAREFHSNDVADTFEAKPFHPRIHFQRGQCNAECSNL